MASKQVSERPMIKSPILDNIFEEICFGVTFFFFESDHGELWL